MCLYKAVSNLDKVGLSFCSFALNKHSMEKNMEVLAT